MWSSIMPPQGHSFMPAKQQQREFGMFVALPVTLGKSFRNPNFVNNFNKYQNTVKPVDSSTKNYQNSCHIIDSIKEKCPEVIPSVDEDTLSHPRTTPASLEMCLDNNKVRPHKKEHTPRKKRQSGKHSRQNQKAQLVKEMLQEEGSEDTFGDLTEPCSPPEHHSTSLESLIQKPSPIIYSKKMVKSNQIPKKEMVCPIGKVICEAIYPSSHQYSVSDSEDSFIIFDHDGNEEELMEDDECFINKESLCSRLRRPSICESEDSFILFERGDVDSQPDDEDNDSDYYFDSSDEESDQEGDCYNDLHNEHHCDETDSSFSIVEPKKVRFASDHKLCEVHPMIKWSYAYQAARKGPWEMYARDRCRFKERSHRVEREIKHVFDPQHRDRIYRERFENL